MKAELPCLHCPRVTVVDAAEYYEDLRSRFEAMGCVWDRGWFCSSACRDAFNLYAPSSGWDRVRKSIEPKGEA